MEPYQDGPQQQPSSDEEPQVAQFYPGQPYPGQPYYGMYPDAPGNWPPNPVPLTRRAPPRWLILAGLALAFALALGLGAFIGGALHSTASAASLGPGSSFNAQGPAGPQAFFAGTPGVGAPGQCDAYTVTSVSGNTIVATNANGTSVTIHTSSSTTYTQHGQAATASAVTVGSHIHVQGTTNSDGSIDATSIDVG